VERKRTNNTLRTLTWKISKEAVMLFRRMKSKKLSFWRAESLTRDNLYKKKPTLQDSLVNKTRTLLKQI